MDLSAAMKVALKVCCYNYKGGCGKTTIHVNAAAAAAEQGKKVLQIDLDPQCNTTQFWNPADDVGTMSDDSPMIAAASSMMELKGQFSGTKLFEDRPHEVNKASEMSDFVGSELKTPLYEMMHSLFYKSNQNKLEEILNKPIDQVLCACNPDKFDDRLWLLKGSPLLSEFEAELTRAIGPRDETPTERNYMYIGIFSFIINKLVDKHGFDIVFIDVSPSNSGLNQVAALSCDYILPPCQASLYSCGSVYGLLTSVLPGENGWFGKHARISNKQWSGKTDLAPEPEWRLPKDQPKLLPILITNYDQEVVQGDTDKRQIRFAPSQFFFTLRKYVQECPYVEGNEDIKGDEAHEKAKKVDPKVVFEHNYGRAVLPFAPSVPVSIAASEAMGRPFIELNLKHFEDFFGFNPEEADTESQQAEGPSAKKRKAKSQTFGKRPKRISAAAKKALLEVGDEGANAVFEYEVSMMKDRFTLLARWLIELQQQKGGAPSGSAPLMVPA